MQSVRQATVIVRWRFVSAEAIECFGQQKEVQSAMQVAIPFATIQSVHYTIIVKE